MPKRSMLFVFCTTCVLAFQSGTRSNIVVTPGVQAVLDHIRAGSLRGDLSFIASDLLEGRNSPSRGLDIAAEYIAAQFRRAGLEPAGDDGYFQTVRLASLEPILEGFELKLTSGDRTLAVEAKEAAVSTTAAL